jgi:hypothetical protein
MTTDHKIHRGLHPSCHRRTGPHGRAVILHTMMLLRLRTAMTLNKYESLHYREFAHTRVYDENLLGRVGLDEELPTILWSISWGKLYNEPHLGSRLLTLEFLITFETVEKNRKSFVKFRLFRKSFGCDFSLLENCNSISHRGCRSTFCVSIRPSP